ncbi:hypothetical protein GCWU000341_02976 [Oribacterium sp. oral taxon 078 str. F0262]|nr:hypothetical protein GCWU000341_02976 [Oribacterium sp. oral taxon 078 str. F0262]
MKNCSLFASGDEKKLKPMTVCLGLIHSIFSEKVQDYSAIV